MVEDRAIDWEDDPTTSLQRRGLHARLPIRMDAKARYVTDSGAIMYSNCLLVPASARDMEAAPAGALGYGPEASIGAEEMEAAARAVFAQLLREGLEDGTDLSRRTTLMNPPFAALRDCAAPGVLLEFAVTRPPSLWPWTVSAVRRPKGPVGCPGR